MVSHSREVSIEGSNFPKNPLFGGTKRYPVYAQATGHGKRSATPRLSPSPGGYPTDVHFLGDLLRYVRFASYPRPSVLRCHDRQWANGYYGHT